MKTIVTNLPCYQGERPEKVPNPYNDPFINQINKIYAKIKKKNTRFEARGRRS